MAESIPRRDDDGWQARLAHIGALLEKTIAAQADTIRAQEALLAIARHERDEARRRLAVVPTKTRHWFIPIEAGDHGICQACGLPEANARHAKSEALD